jgi:hypothetical protein
MLKVSLIISLFAVMAFNDPEKKKIKVWLIGDSTMSAKEKKAFPETGWGMPFANFWDSTVTIDNRAKNGRSSKSFIKENLATCSGQPAGRRLCIHPVWPQ